MDFKPLATLSLLASLSLVTSQSFAATVNYDFTLTNAAAGTTVTGEIDGLTVGGTNVSPSAVFITGYALSTTIVSSFQAFVFPTPLQINNFSGGSDLFSLNASGVLTAADFNGSGAYVTNCTGVSCLVDLAIMGSLSGGGFNAGVDQVVTPAGGSLIANGGDLTPSFTQVSSTPLPAALPLFAGGLGMVGFLARRKKKQATVA